MIGHDAPLVSIVAPMFNEADGIDQFAAQLGDALAALEARGVPRTRVEVIAVDDGSRDETPQRLASLERAGRLRVVTHDANRGLGAALWSGFAAARAEVIATVDSDCTYPLREVGALYGLLDGGTGIVTASPYHPSGGVSGVPAWRLLLSRTLSRLYDVVLRSDIHTFTAMFRIYRRDVLGHVPTHADGFIAVTHLLVFPLLDHVVVREYPTVLGVRRFGTSKIKIVRVIVQHLPLLMRLALLRLRRAR